MSDVNALRKTHRFMPIRGTRERMAGLQAQTDVDCESLPTDFLITLVTQEDEFFFIIEEFIGRRFEKPFGRVFKQKSYWGEARLPNN